MLMRDKTIRRIFDGLLLVAGLCGLFTGTPATAQDGTPSGMVAFFMAAQCPSGWNAASVAQGRLVVGVTDPTAVGVMVGPPLTNQTAPSHGHAYATTVNLTAKSIAAASSCCNDQGAKAQGYTVSGNTGSATSNLPFIQLVACQKQ
jgi:hypothetical protein